MVAHLELDFLIEAGFYYLGRWPIALMDAIGQKKDQEFEALQPNPLEPESFIASDTFVVEDRVFDVIFGSDKQRQRQYILRVMAIYP